MTRDPRADELLAESMDLLDSLATYIRGPGFEHTSLEIADKISEIRAYLDEPQDERVDVRARPEDPPLYIRGAQRT